MVSKRLPFHLRNSIANNTSRRARFILAFVVIALTAGGVAASASSGGLGRLLRVFSWSSGAITNSSPQKQEAARAAATAKALMVSARSGQTATTLKDGRVVIAGGRDASGQVLSSVEIFDPVTNASTVFGSLTQARESHTASLLADGRLFIAGGSNGEQALRSTEIFNPNSGISTAGPDMSAARSGHSANAVHGGNFVLIVGADGGGEMFNARTGSFSGPGTKSGISSGISSSTKFSVQSNESEGGATITTDREDYPPYSTVVISGSGFTAGETVNLMVEQISPTQASYEPWTAVADENGNILTSWFIYSADFAGATLQVTATGQTSGLSASAIFTDALGAGIAQTGDPNGFNIDGGIRSQSTASPSPAAQRTDWLNNTTSGGSGGVVNEDGSPKTGLAAGPVYLVNDNFNSNDDVFSGGKTDDNPNSYTWSTGSTNAKTDLNRVYVHIAKNTTTQHAWVIVSADHNSTNGSTDVSFEMNQVPIVKNANGTFSSAGPNNGRTIGDLLVTADYGGSGSTAVLTLYKWDVGGSSGYQWTDITAAASAANAAFASSNGAAITLPYTAFGTSNYASGQWVEVAVDISQLVTASINPCAGLNISSVWVRSQNSPSTSASLGDFATPVEVSFSAGFTATSVASPSTYPGTITTTPNGGTAPFTYAITDASVNIAPASGYQSSNQFTGLLPGSYKIWVKATGGCTVASNTVTIGKANPAINATGGTFTYDGAQHAGSGSATGTLSENLTPVTLSYSGTGSTTYGPTATAPTNAGTYNVTASYAGDSNYNPATSAPAALTINKVAVTATAGSYGPAAYDGNTHALSACVVTGYAGLSCTNSPTGPVGPNVGSGTVTPDTSTISTTNFIITPVNGSWSITPATANCSVTPYDVPYDGSAHSAAGSCTGVGGANISGGLTINSTHTNAGTYSGDSWSFTLANYTSIPSTSITDKISPVAVTATAGSYGPAAYDGNTHALSACVVTGYAGLSCTNSPTGPVGPNVGSGTVTPDTSSISTTNFIITPVNGSWSITQATANCSVTPYNVPYDGTLKTASGSCSGLGGTVNLTSGLNLTNTQHTNAGNYPTDSWSFHDAAGNFADISATTITDNISQVAVTATAGSYGPAPYDGNTHALSACVVTGYAGLSCTNSPTGPVGPNVGSGTVTPDTSSISTTNFIITPVNGSWSITQVAVTATAGSYGPAAYDGNTHALSACVVTGYAGLSCTNNPTGPVGPNVGSGTVTPDTSSISTTNFIITPVNGSWSITQATANCSVTPYNVPYDGTLKTASGSCSGLGGTVNLTSGLNLTNTQHTNAGNYPTDSWSFHDAAGNFADISATTITDNISQVAVTATAGSYGPAPYDGNTHALSACVVTGYAGLSCTNSPTGPVGPNVGSGTVTPDTSSISTTNFIITPVNGSWSITQVAVTATAGSYGPAAYDGNTHALSACVVTGYAGLSCTNSPTGPVGPNVGSGTVTPDTSSISTTNFIITPVNGSWSITQATANCSVTPYNVPYDGTLKTASGSCSGLGGTVNLTSGLNLTNTQHTNAGNYPTDSWSFHDAAGNFADISATTITDNISQVAVTATAGSYGPAPYDGNTHALSACVVTGYAGLSCTNNPTGPVGPNVGSGTVTPDTSSISTTNFIITPVNGSWSITQVAVTATAGSYGPAAYDGNTHALSACVVTGYAGLSCTNNPTGPVGPNVGSGTVTPDTSSISTTNFIITPVNGSWSITQATANCSVTPYNVPYDGTLKTASGSCSGLGGTVNLTSGLNLTNTQHTNAGNYPTDSWSFHDAAGNFADISATTITDNISQVAVTATAGSYGPAPYDGNTHALSACVVTGYAGLSCTNSPTGPVGPNVGSGTVTPDTSSISTTNFIITPVNGSWSITQVAVTATAGSYGPAAYDGNTHALSACVVTGYAGLSCTNSPTGPVGPNVGSGTVTPDTSSISTTNFIITPVNGSWSITQAPVTATAGSGSGIYNGSTQSPGGCVVTGTYTGDLTCTNSPTSVGPGIGTTTITPVTNGTGLSNFSLTPVNGSYTINKAATAITFNGPTSNQDFACGSLGTYTATLKDTSNNVGLNGVSLILTIGGQTATATTANNGLIDGVATFTLVLNQAPGTPGETVGLNAAWADGNRTAPATQSGPFTVLPDTNVGPANGTSLYTGPSFSWTTSPTSSTTTLTLNATIKDTSVLCVGDITRAKVSFFVSSNQGQSFNPVSNAQNLPVGLVNPGDTSVGTASTTSQYNIGSNLAITLIVRVVVGGEYALPGGNNSDYDVPVVIAVPGQPNTLAAGGKLVNSATSLATVAGAQYYANGYLGNGNGITGGGLAAGDVDFGGFVQCNNSKCTNPQGQLNAKIHTYNKPDGSVDSTVHHYFVKTNAISGWGTTGTGASGSGFFSAKTNLFETTGGSSNGLDGGGMMQMIFANPGASYTYTSTQGNKSVTLTCPSGSQYGCASIILYRSNGLGGGVWFSSAWGPVTAGDLPQTIMKGLTGGTIAYTSGPASKNTLTVMSTGTKPTTTTASPTTAASSTVTDNSLVSNLGGMFVTGSNSTVGNASVPSVVDSAASRPDQRRSFSGRAQLSNDGSDTSKFFAAEGSLGHNWVSSLFDSSVQFVSSSANAEGAVSITVRSCNKPDGSLDKRCVAGKPSTHHVYLLETNVLTGATLISGATTFASKTNVYEVMANGSKIALDDESSMQIMFIAKSQMIPLDAGAAGGTTCMDDSGCVAIAAQKSAGGIWYSGAWGLSSGIQGEAANSH